MSDARHQVVVYLRQYADGDLEKQLDRIRNYANKNNLEIISVKTESNNNQIVLNEILSGIKSQKYPHLLVWDLFTLTVSPLHLDSIFAVFLKSSSHLTIVKDQLSTTDSRELVFSVGKMMLRYAIGSQRLIIKEGQRRARKEGKQMGRPGVSEKKLVEAKELRDKGLSYRQIGRLLKLDESTVRKNLKRFSETK